MAIPTAAEIGHALAELGNYRVLRVQEVCYPYHPIPASVMLGIGFRETGLRNICGGATWDGTASLAGCCYALLSLHTMQETAGR
jgi:hypothetical protein